MAILNLASDGLPSVLVVLIRTLREKGPLEHEQLRALVAPPSLQQVSTTFRDGVMVRQTITRWSQIGLFVEQGDRIALADGMAEGSTRGVRGLRTLGAQLRRFALAEENNEDLVRTEPKCTADFTHALCWMLAQDPFVLTTGGYDEVVNRMESDQFTEEPWAFRNGTRWSGFVPWANLLGFGWGARVPRANTFICDPTAAVADALPEVFGDREEVTQDDFFHALASALPVVDGGTYRTQVEDRLVGSTWRPTQAHEVSPCLTLSLLRLEESGRLRLDSRSDAPHRTLLGQGFREVRSVSHVCLPRTS